MISFNADEIYEMAEQIERNGAKFYRRAADLADRGGRTLLLRLAAMENDHEKTFAAMRAELSVAQKRPITADPDSEAALYLRAMADGKVFAAHPDDAFAGRKSMRDILLIAIGLEKDSIVFYESMKEIVPPPAGKERLDDIIRQEIGHIVDIGEQIAALKN